MFRITAFLLLLSILFLSSTAIPTPSNSLITRQATRAGILSKLQRSPVRRQGPSPLPAPPPIIRIQVPTDSANTAYAGRYIVGDRAAVGLTASGVSYEQGTNYRITTAGDLQLGKRSDGLLLHAIVDQTPINDSQVFLYDSAVEASSAGGRALTCSVGVGNALNCVDGSARVIGVASNGELRYATAGLSPVVVVYL